MLSKPHRDSRAMNNRSEKDVWILAEEGVTVWMEQPLELDLYWRFIKRVKSWNAMNWLPWSKTCASELWKNCKRTKHGLNMFPRLVNKWIITLFVSWLISSCFATSFGKSNQIFMKNDLISQLMKPLFSFHFSVIGSRFRAVWDGDSVCLCLSLKWPHFFQKRFIPRLRWRTSMHLRCRSKIRLTETGPYVRTVESQITHFSLSD